MRRMYAVVKRNVQWIAASGKGNVESGVPWSGAIGVERDPFAALLHGICKNQFGRIIAYSAKVYADRAI